MASALSLVVEAHLAKADAALLAAVVAGQLMLGIIYVRTRAGKPVHWRLSGVFWTAQAVGILLKGPAAPALALLTAATPRSPIATFVGSKHCGRSPASS